MVSEVPPSMRNAFLCRAEPSGRSAPEVIGLRFDITECPRIKKAFTHRVYACFSMTSQCALHGAVRRPESHVGRGFQRDGRRRPRNRSTHFGAGFPAGLSADVPACLAE